MIYKPSTAKYKYNVDGDKGLTQVIASSGGHELIAVLVTAGGAAVAARIYDTDTANQLDTTQSVLIAANQGESTSFTPVQPIPMNKGIYVVIEQGGNQGGEVFLLYN